MYLISTNDPGQERTGTDNTVRDRGQDRREKTRTGKHWFKLKQSVTVTVLSLLALRFLILYGGENSAGVAAECNQKLATVCFI